MIAPAVRLIHCSTRDVKRARRRDTLPDRNNHQSVEPRNTPITINAACAESPVEASPAPAKMPANIRIVDGLVNVSSMAEPYEPASDVREALAASKAGGDRIVRQPR